jgi:hypothetical protein
LQIKHSFDLLYVCSGINSYDINLIFITRERNIIFLDQKRIIHSLAYSVGGTMSSFLIDFYLWAHAHIYFFIDLRFETLVPFYFLVIYLLEVSDTCPFLFPRSMNSSCLLHNNAIRECIMFLFYLFFDTRNMIILSTKAIIINGRMITIIIWFHHKERWS